MMATFSGIFRCASGSIKRKAPAQAVHKGGTNYPGQVHITPVCGKSSQNQNGLPFKEGFQQDGQVTLGLDQRLKRHYWNLSFPSTANISLNGMPVSILVFTSNILPLRSFSIFADDSLAISSIPLSHSAISILPTPYTRAISTLHWLMTSKTITSVDPHSFNCLI